MARISGVNIPDNKKVPYSLRYIKGIGLMTAMKICAALNIDPDSRVKDLDGDRLIDIKNYLDENEILVEGQLDAEVRRNIKRLMDIRCYRGLRHRKGLPVRGQRTHTNARTRKGPAVSIAGKKK